MSFQQSLAVGKTAEDYAIKYFEKRNWKYEDVRDKPEYQRKDIDFIAEGINYEVKLNYHNAKYYHPGLYIWIELETGRNPGWWYYCEADYYMFYNVEGNGLLIKQDNIFRDRIDYLIENGEHEGYGLNRFDYITEGRKYGPIKIKVMRVYLEQIEGLYTKIVKRKRI